MSTFIQSPAHSLLKLDTSSPSHVVGAGGPRQPKQLKRLPHVFCKWLDLPFAEDTNVEIEESRERYKFMVRQAGLSQTDVVAEAVEIVPGAVKVTLRGHEKIRAMLKLNSGGNWRARLPAIARTEAAKSTYVNGIITITIPKLPASATGPPPPPSPPNSRHRCGPQDVNLSLPCLV
ncbi:hypothetical protein GOP47_0014122 [Adiantum capillus-veneris]|uniref:SHSP domain-containing protein n=1 Tax=Adiantum capillus-veneris TaxID=13818 RepID=A0A9D4UQ16_ADICA|nr:hypothetical protein GOP47_0014122 [Adiantum capillus-veneris]